MEGSPIIKLLKLITITFTLTKSAVESCPHDCTCSQQIIRCGTKQKLSIISKTFISAIPLYAKCINLSNNNLTEFPTVLFKSFTELEVIILNHNNLTRVPEKISTTLPGVTTLKMKGNRVSDLTAIKYASKLKCLDLSRNTIEKLYSDNCGVKTPCEYSVFRDLTLLEYLDLSNNQITEIASNTFHYLLHLKYLSLSNNSLQFLPEHLFMNTNALEELKLNHNNLQNLTKDTFHGLKKVSTIDLRNNKIETIHAATFKNINITGKIILNNNPLKCVSSMLVDELRDLILTEKITGGCYFKQSYYKKLIDFYKDSGHTSEAIDLLWTVLAISLLLIFTFSVSTCWYYRVTIIEKCGFSKAVLSCLCMTIIIFIVIILYFVFRVLTLTYYS